jgi:hypothetical protein
MDKQTLPVCDATSDHRLHAQRHALTSSGVSLLPRNPLSFRQNTAATEGQAEERRIRRVLDINSYDLANLEKYLVE